MLTFWRFGYETTSIVYLTTAMGITAPSLYTAFGDKKRLFLEAAQRPILDAAHIRSYADGGEHSVANGLLLRTDIHRLFDLGYVTVTDQGRFAVSERLRADFDNGVHYYAMRGQELALPARGYAPPAAEALHSHRENRYLGYATAGSTIEARRFSAHRQTRRAERWGMYDASRDQQQMRPCAGLLSL